MPENAKEKADVKPEESLKVYPYYIENPLKENRVERFLEIFAAVLNYSDYKPL